MYRYYIEFIEDDVEKAEKGVVSAENIGKAARDVARYYGAHLEDYTVTALNIYEIDGILTDTELNQMIEI